MKSLLTVLSTMALTLSLMGCAKEASQEAATTPAEPAKPAASLEASAAPEAAAIKSEEAKPVEAKPDVVAPVLKATRLRTVEIPQGTAISIVLTDAISTAKDKAGDVFLASLADPIVVNGEIIVSRGATVNGRVVDAEGSGRVKGTAHIRLTLTSIVAGGKSYTIVTRPFVAEAEATKGRDAGVVAGGGGVGAAIGALAGGKKGAAAGALIGAAAGTTAVLATKGKEVEFNSETRLTFALEEPAELPKSSR